MQLHLYRNSGDKWHDLRRAATSRGGVLASNAATLDELVERLTLDVFPLTAGQRLFLTERAIREAGLEGVPGIARYASDAIAELKAALVSPSVVKAAEAHQLASIFEYYEGRLRSAGFADAEDRRRIAADRLDNTWLKPFDSVVLHALYDLTETEFRLVAKLIERLPAGGEIQMFNSTANIRPTELAEWTWKRFIENESLAERTFPEFCRSSRPILGRLFVFEPMEALGRDESIRVVEAPGRYREVEWIGAEIADLLISGVDAREIALAVRHLDTYGEMIEDVFTRYRIPHGFGPGVPLLRVPYIKYWLSFLDLATGERRREDFARILASAYYEPRLTPEFDVAETLAAIGYIDRQHLPASALAMRRPVVALQQQFLRLETILDQIETVTDSFRGFLGRLPGAIKLAGRDAQAWEVLREELEAVDSVSGPVPFGEFRRIASAVAGMRTVGRFSQSAVAPGVSRVQVLSPHDLAFREFRYLFAPGLADGEFPSRAAANPLMPDDAVQAINATLGRRVILDARDRSRREPLYLFAILDSARDQVTLSYPGLNLAGETVYPSIYVAEVLRHFDGFKPLRMGRDLSAREPGEWLRLVADEWRAGKLLDGTARDALGDDVVRGVAHERRAANRANVGQGTLRTDVPWNPSELNDLRKCPFVFLARRRLRIDAPEPPGYDISYRDLGVLAHRILRDFHSLPVPAASGEARGRMAEIVAKNLSNADTTGQGPGSVFDPDFWRIRRATLVAAMSEYAAFAVEDAKDGHVTVLEFLDSPLPQADFGGVRMAGRADHVSIRRSPIGIDSVRIDDFKYSAASDAKDKELHGSFQLPVYAHLVLEALNVREKEWSPGLTLEGRYLLLRSPRRPEVSMTIDEGVMAEAAEKIRGLVGQVRLGLTAPLPLDRKDCDRCGYRRLCRYYAV